VRPATVGDVADVVELIAGYAAEGRMLPRSAAQIEHDIDSYVVVVDDHERVVACAALYVYSPSLAEIGCVAVHPDHQGLGLGTMAVRGAEALARRRGVGELFALTLTDGFFESLGDRRTMLDRFPEKLARYRDLASNGVEIVPKSCYHKITGWA
jgi:amino-acid N-acetyltransferase